ncbi:MAG: hypothetical protein LBE74_03200 [Treponema sp.]|nr:hypothetical protein [Treponema sp.]
MRNGLCRDLFIQEAVIVFPQFPPRVKNRLGFRTKASSLEEAAHKGGVELLFRVHLFFGKQYPAVHAMPRGDAVLPVKQGKREAVVLKGGIDFPAVVGVWLNRPRFGNT